MPRVGSRRTSVSSSQSSRSKQSNAGNGQTAGELDEEVECVNPYSTKRFVAPPGGVVATMELAPPRDEYQSKRYGVYLDQVEGLEANREYLKQQAIEKDRQFKKNVAALRQRVDQFRRLLEKESRDQEEEDARVKLQMKGVMDSVEEDFMAALDEVCTRVNTEWIPKPMKRVDAWKQEFDEFVTVTIPKTIESQSGRVTRHLIKSQETFEIDNTKLWKRELKIVRRFEEHQVQSLAEVRELGHKRRACFVLLEEEVESQTRNADKAEERFQAKVCNRIVEVQEMESGLAGVRQDTDDSTLLAIEQAMRKVQENIMKNFGMNRVEAAAAGKSNKK